MYVTFLSRAEEYEIKNDHIWLFSLLKPEKCIRSLSHFCFVPNRVRDRDEPKFTISLWKPKNVRCRSHFCCVPNEYQINNDQTLLFLLCKPKKKTVRCQSHLGCVPNRVRDREITKVNYFTLQTKKVCVDECHISAACRKEYELKNDHIWLFSLLKPEKCTMFVTFLLRAEKGTR